VPEVDVREGCDAGKNSTTRSENVDANGRRHIRVRICTADIARAAQRSADIAGIQADRAARQADLAEARAERAAQRSARTASLQAEQAERQADLAEARAERAARSDHASALAGLRTARGQISRNTSMPAYARAQALREIDASIAELRSEQP
jgi:hypothetical protein